ncbi:MAG: hypothetical protein ABIO40_10180 [Devosia sp.]
MKSVRLLPVVIFAALSLLLFKSIGLVSHGGYVLTGTEATFASGGEAASEGEAGEEAALPNEITIADTSPMLGDTAPTIGIKAEASGEAGHGETPSDTSHAEAAAESAQGEAAAETGAAPAEGAAHGESEEIADIPDIACPGVEPSSEEPAHEPATDNAALTDRIGNALASGCPSVETPVNEFGDAVPTTKDGTGAIVPLAEVEGDNAETAVLERLSARRAELDQFAADLEMRAALVEAAEKRIAERTVQLEQLEAQINALVDQKQAGEDLQFKSVVSMYETMKPRDAGKIFDALDLNVLLRVARAMNPRKMAPVLAAMNAQRAQELTAAMATDRPPPMVAEAGEDLANLPQIVGN